MKTYKYRVFSLDIWGHGSNECCEGYGCPCVVDCEECSGTGAFGDGDTAHDCHECEGDGKHHNDVDCDAEFTVNDRFHVGTIDVLSANNSPSDQQLLDALIADGLMKETVNLTDVEFDDNGTGENIYINDAKNGRPKLELEYQEE